MSAKQVGKVWEYQFTPAKQQVMLAYADRADHNGEHIEASYPLIAWMTGYSERQVIRISKALEADGVLVVTFRQRGLTNRYRFDWSKATPKPSYEARSPRKPKRDDILTSNTGDKMTSKTDVTTDIAREDENSGRSDMASAKTARKTYKDKEIISIDTHTTVPDVIRVTWEREIGALDDETTSKLASAMTDYGEVWVLDAIAAARRSKPNAALHVNYVIGVLKRWRAQGKPDADGASKAVAPKATSTNPADKYLSGRYGALIEH